MLGHNWTPADMVMVISAIFTGVCSIIAALKATKSEKISKVVSSKATDNSDKLDSIHSLTDGNLTRTQQELELEKIKNAHLQRIIIELSEECPKDKIAAVMKKVNEEEAKIGKRRRSDQYNHKNYEDCGFENCPLRGARA